MGVRAFVELAGPGGVVAGEVLVLRGDRDRLVSLPSLSQIAVEANNSIGL
jgi:hypothetical protein